MLFRSVWDYSSVPHCEPVYRADLKKEDYDYILDNLSEVLGNVTVYLTKLKDSSPFTSYLRDRYTPYKKRSGGTIELLRTYDYTYRMIMKECRDNIEEAENKIAAEGLTYRTDIYCNKPISFSTYSDTLRIVNGEEAKGISRLRYRIQAKHSAMIQSLKNGKDSVVAVSYIDDYPVACLFG